MSVTGWKEFYDLGVKDGYEGVTGERVFKSKDDAESYNCGLADGKALKAADEKFNDDTAPDTFDALEAEEIKHGYLFGHYSDEHIRKYGGPS